MKTQAELDREHRHTLRLRELEADICRRKTGHGVHPQDGPVGKIWRFCGCKRFAQRVADAKPGRRRWDEVIW